MLVASTVKRPPLGTTSWSFTNTEPSDIKYDVKHSNVVTIGNCTKMEEEHWNMNCSSGAGEVSGQPSNPHIYKRRWRKTHSRQRSIRRYYYRRYKENI